MNGKLLVNIIGGHTAICRDTQNTLALRYFGSGGNLVYVSAVLSVKLTDKGILFALSFRLEA